MFTLAETLKVGKCVVFKDGKLTSSFFFFFFWIYSLVVIPFTVIAF